MNPIAPTEPTILLASTDPEAPAARACLTAYFALLAARIPGLSATHLPDPDPDADLYRPPHGLFLVAMAGDAPIGSVALKPLGSGLGEVKRLWVDPAARGQGLARRLMRAIEDEARRLGLTRLKLDTNEHLPEAIALYAATGWTPTTPYTDWPATHWFEKAL